MTQVCPKRSATQRRDADSRGAFSLGTCLLAKQKKVPRLTGRDPSSEKSTTAKKLIAIYAVCISARSTFRSKQSPAIPPHSSEIKKPPKRVCRSISNCLFWPDRVGSGSGHRRNLALGRFHGHGRCRGGGVGVVERSRSAPVLQPPSQTVFSLQGSIPLRMGTQSLGVQPFVAGHLIVSN
jgi:hypothetical protein